MSLVTLASALPSAPGMTSASFQQRHEGHGSNRARVDERTGDPKQIDHPPLFSAADPVFLSDPYPLYARLRTEDPIHRTPHGLWILTRYADVAAVLRDSRFGREGFERHFGMGGGSTANGASDGLAATARLESGGHRQSMLFRDPPHHTRLRDAVSRAFTPRAVETLRPRIQDHVDALLDCVASAGRLDVIADLAEPLPRAVIGELLGIPEAHRPACAAWSTAVARSLDALPIPEDRPLVAEGQAARHPAAPRAASISGRPRSQRY